MPCMYFPRVKLYSEICKSKYVTCGFSRFSYCDYKTFCFHSIRLLTTGAYFLSLKTLKTIITAKSRLSKSGLPVVCVLMYRYILQ